MESIHSRVSSASMASARASVEPLEEAFTCWADSAGIFTSVLIDLCSLGSPTAERWGPRQVRVRSFRSELSSLVPLAAAPAIRGAKQKILTEARRSDLAKALGGNAGDVRQEDA